jgi:GT2 family glycosyltransferase
LLGILITARTGGPIMNAGQKLSWGLVIATYQRENVLIECLKLAISQTVKPVEIIIIDGSPNWDRTRSKILSEVGGRSDNIRWRYEAADALSIPVQRNQGIRLATADIVFLIDDDSLMYPTCAEEILKVYEADKECTVKGVQPELAPPPQNMMEEERKETGYFTYESLARRPALKSILNWVGRQIFLMNVLKMFIPYDGSFHLKLPQGMNNLKVVPTALLEGCRMTYRLDAIRQEPFESHLLYYAAGEDLDASYRVSRHGCLLTAIDAQLHHYQSKSGRMSRFAVTSLSATNLAFCIRKHSTTFRKNKQQYYVLMIRRIIAETFKDILSRRWTLPQVRGLLFALIYADKIFSSSQEDLAKWYPLFQSSLFSSDRLTVDFNNHVIATTTPATISLGR